MIELYFMTRIPRSDRRSFLQHSSIALVGGLAGCSALSSQPSMLDLTIVNHTETPYTVVIDLLRSDGNRARSDARSYDASIDVDPQDEARRENIIEAKHYLIRYTVYENDRRETDKDHVHYYPPNNERDDELTFDIRSPGTLTRR